MNPNPEKVNVALNVEGIQNPDLLTNHAHLMDMKNCFSFWELGMTFDPR